jgi:hypothetical protein
VDEAETAITVDVAVVGGASRAWLPPCHRAAAEVLGRLDDERSTTTTPLAQGALA